MRFVYSEIGLDIKIPEDSILIITLEKPEIFRMVLNDLWLQINGNEGGAIFSEDGEILKLSKVANMVFNPLGIDCNDRKVLNALYSEMKEIASEDQIDNVAIVNQKQIELLDNIAEKLEYAITYDLDIDVTDIFKMYGVKLLAVDDGLASRIIDYIKLLHRILKINTFIFVNLKHYLNATEISGIYEAVLYEKVSLVIVQAYYCDKIVGEYNVIVDSDMCIIEP